MKNLIIILSLFLFACKKETTNLSGNWKHVGVIVHGIHKYDSIPTNEVYIFNDNGTYSNTIKGNGTYIANQNSIHLNNVQYRLEIRPRMIFIGNDIYFN